MDDRLLKPSQSVGASIVSEGLKFKRPTCRKCYWKLLILYTNFNETTTVEALTMPTCLSRHIRALFLTGLMLTCISFRLSAQYTLRIGVIDQPDGSLLAGARLAAQHVNEAGGITGADGAVFQLAVVDTPPDHMEIAAANMRQASVIAVIGPETNHDLARNIGSLQGLDVPVLSPATGETVLLTDTSGNIFRSRAPERQQIRGLADYLVNSLGISSIHTIQLDAASTANLISLANTLAVFGIRPSNLRYDETRPNLDQIVASIAGSSPDAVAIYGPPRLAAKSYNALRAAGYTGELVYLQADDPDFIELVPVTTLPGIISASTWSYALEDAASQDFTLSYARAFGELPDALSAAGYDSVRLIAAAAAGRGMLADELAAIPSFPGVQGPLSPAESPPSDISNNVVVTRLNEYGAAIVVSRNLGQERQESQAESVMRDTATPIPTATPTGYHLIVQSEFQNIRSGPGLDYEVIGQALRGAQLRVLGATADYRWLVIDYRGQWGWLAGYLVETIGNRNLAPIVQPPATPTPAPTATAAPPREPDLIVLSVSPNRITLGQATSVNVTVRNQGQNPAGNFAIASTFMPGSRYAGVNQRGLAAGQQTIVQLQPTLDGPSGPQSVVIVVDLNNEVYEGPAGEANNQSYSYAYIADRPVLTSGKWTIAPGTFDLDGDAVSDFSWTGNDLLAQGNAAMRLMNRFASLHDAHYDAIDLSQANIISLNADQLQNATVGIVTADGRRGAMRLTDVTRNGSLSVEYRVYR